MTGPIAVVDVGGTDTKTGIVLPDGGLTEVRSVPTPSAPDAAEEVLRLAAEHVTRARANHPDLTAVGMVVPGIVDDATGTAVYSANLNWRDVPFAELLTRRAGLPAAVGHDVTAAGLAERRLGAGLGVDDLAVLVLGTGVAAALVSGGRAVRGGGYAGEVGHSPVGLAGERCRCGARGCVETLAGGGAITRRYAARTGRAVPGVREVLAAAEAGDPDAAEVWREATDTLALLIAQLAATLAPELVILGGGLARAGTALLDPVADRLGTLLSVPRRPELRLTALGAEAGLRGAGLLAAGERP